MLSFLYFIHQTSAVCTASLNNLKSIILSVGLLHMSVKSIFIILPVFFLWTRILTLFLGFCQSPFLNMLFAICSTTCVKSVIG